MDIKLKKNHKLQVVKAHRYTKFQAFNKQVRCDSVFRQQRLVIVTVKTATDATGAAVQLRLYHFFPILNTKKYI